MNRRWIGIEQMNYIEDITLKRLTKSLTVNKASISKGRELARWWFICLFLAKKITKTLDKIIATNSKGELDDVYTRNG